MLPGHIARAILIFLSFFDYITNENDEESRMHSRGTPLYSTRQCIRGVSCACFSTAADGARKDENIAVHAIHTLNKCALRQSPPLIPAIERRAGVNGSRWRTHR